MPLPLILGIGAAIAAVGGVGAGIHGGVKMKDAKDTMEAAQCRHDKNMKKYNEATESTTSKMDALGTLEIDILKGFGKFSDTIEKIQNRPEFKSYKKDNVTLPKYDPEKIKEVSVAAGAVAGALGGAAAGTAGGFAAAGATTAAVMALGTASTGTAIATLSGAAATNATLAALGGGALAAGGGGMALGSAILGASTLGVGLLVGGIIFNFTGGKLSDKADEAWYQVKEETEKVEKICTYLDELKDTAGDYIDSLKKVKRVYDRSFAVIDKAVNIENRTDWKKFTKFEQKSLENTVLLVALLYKMCKVNLVLKAEEDDGINSVNKIEADKTMNDADELLMDIVA